MSEDRKILANKIQCVHCKDIIESTHRHDFKWCSCKTVAVDGGKYYERRLFHKISDYIELTEYEDKDANIPTRD